jgi:hypothetical protein
MHHLTSLARDTAESIRAKLPLSDIEMNSKVKALGVALAEQRTRSK